VTGTPAIVVDTFNGSVEVTAGGAASVEVSWTKRGSSSESMEAAKADLANVAVTVASSPGEVRVTAKRTDGRAAHSSGARFSLVVPRGCPVTLVSSNGSLEVKGVGASVIAQTSNGRIAVEGGKGSLTLSTSNGRVEAGGEAVVLDAKSSNGSVTFSGSLADGSQRARTSNGSIELTLPKDARFRLDADTSNGSVTSDFPLAETTGKDKSSLRGIVGTDPKASVVLETSNGSIHVRRAP
jgi:DUF4097 and DUF4098 domain-containing protein YvlB